MRFKVGDLIKPKDESLKEVVYIAMVDKERKQYYLSFLSQPLANGWMSSDRIDNGTDFLPDGNDILKGLCSK